MEIIKVSPARLEGIDSKIWGLDFWQPNLVEKTEVFMSKVYCFVEYSK
jgi:hypothetical protein